MVAASNESAAYRSQQVKSFSYRPTSLVTSTVFDNDDVFCTVAHAMLFRYENEGLNERDAICGVLVTAEQKRQFIDSMESRFMTTSNVTGHEEAMAEDSPANEIIGRFRFSLGDTLKELWRESDKMDFMTTEPSNSGSNNHAYQSPLKTPKNTLHSPMKSSSDIAMSDDPQGGGRKHHGQRRRFFPDGDQHNAAGRPAFRWDFHFSSGGQQVQSLQLDGLEHKTSGVLGSYSPPSPISMASRVL